MNKVLSSIAQWSFLIVIASIAFMCFARPVSISIQFITLTGYQVIAIALSLAFTWVYILKWWNTVKPFKCMKCMTGWISLTLAYLYHVPVYGFYLFIGLFIGALVDRAMMRWL